MIRPFFFYICDVALRHNLLVSRENRPQQSRHLLFGGEKIEDREVNSLFDSKESYSGSIILLQERGDIQA